MTDFFDTDEKLLARLVKKYGAEAVARKAKSVETVPVGKPRNEIELNFDLMFMTELWNDLVKKGEEDGLQAPAFYAACAFYDLDPDHHLARSHVARMATRRKRGTHLLAEMGTDPRYLEFKQRYLELAKEAETVPRDFDIQSYEWPTKKTTTKS